MARDTRSKRLVKKSEAAMIAAIEIYNKPTFSYREETFSILSVNAWELLLKAKLIDDNGQDDRCILEYERRRKRDGSLSATRKTVKRNRAGNRTTISIGGAMAKIGKDLPSDVQSNLLALVEIRDNSVHFVNPSFELRKRVLEIGTATVKNFLLLVRTWFKKDLSRLNLHLMPIGFLPSSNVAHAVATDPDERELLKFLNSLVAEQTSDPVFNVALEVDIRLKRSVSTAAARVQVVTNDPTAQRVILTEENIQETYRWTYAVLRKHLASRYSDFKENRRFHSLRKQLAAEKHLVRSRYLDPSNERSGKKDFYSPNIVIEFDKHYTVKAAKTAAVAS